jgi:hypothetical protein
MSEEVQSQWLRPTIDRFIQITDNFQTATMESVPQGKYVSPRFVPP